MRNGAVIDLRFQFIGKGSADVSEAEQIVRRAFRETTANVFLGKFVAVAINQPNIGSGDSAFGTTRERFKHFGQEFPSLEVVGGRDVGELAAREIEPAIERGVKPFARNLMQSKTRIALCDRFKKFPGSVG